MLKAWLTLSVALFLSVTHAQSWEVWKYQPEGRYPEGVTYDPQDRQFYLSSLKHGTVGKLAPGAQYQVFSNDADLISSAGVQVDTLNRRLLVVVHDDGASTRSNPNTKHHLARLVVFDLDSRQKLFSRDLNTLAEGRSHGNDVTLDDRANAYVTDSFRPLIYKVTPEGIPSVFVQDEAFRKNNTTTTKPALNGITYHPGGYLLVTDYEKGKLWRIPMDDPSSFREVQLPGPRLGMDGINLIGKQRLAVARTFEDATQTFISQVDILRSTDDWQSATVVGEHRHTSLNCPTTVEVVGSEIHVTNSHFKELFELPESEHDTREFVLTKIKLTQ